MPCAMSSLRGASGVVGCDRVVCPLVLHATTIAHLDVLLCTLLCFLLCALSALLLCVCPVVCPVPCLPCLWCVCVVLWLWCVGASCPPALPAPVGVCYGVPLYPCAFPVFFPGIIPVLYMGCYRRVLYTPYIRALFFRLGIYDPFCTHSKSRPLDSECGFPKVGLNFRCSVFLLWNFPGKISGLIFP